MNPRLVQKVSNLSSNGRWSQPSVTSLMSQQANPGQLAAFFRDQGALKAPQLQGDGQLEHMEKHAQGHVTVETFSKGGVEPLTDGAHQLMPRVFEEQIQGKEVAYQTPAMRAWGVSPEAQILAIQRFS